QRLSLAAIDPDCDGKQVSDSRAAAQIEAALQRPDLDKVWRQLSQDQREVVGMVHILGHTYAEAAEILKIPIGTVMSRLHRAHRIAARSGT
ncbi:MAG: RNA polymerase sigma factor, partial [Geminicoccaceae bacterium]